MGSHARGSDYITSLSLDGISVSSALEGGQALPNIFNLQRIENADSSDIKFLLTVTKDKAWGDTFDTWRLKTLYYLFAANIALTL
jgi:hypothetical protein